MFARGAYAGAGRPCRRARKEDSDVPQDASLRPRLCHDRDALEAPASADTKPAGKTLVNLETAFNGESNAQARYLAFAKKADADGLPPVASLFRAAARAEEIHAANHAKVIRALGGVPQAQIEEPKVGATKENLDAAIKGESYERDTMYPDFIKTARSEGQKGALESFNYAKSAEAEHPKLYTFALETIRTASGKAPVTYYVSPCAALRRRSSTSRSALPAFAEGPVILVG